MEGPNLFDVVAGSTEVQKYDRTDGADNVVEFRRREPSDTEALEQLGRAPRRACTHLKRRLVDKDQRIVTCAECGATLDPIWCLLTLIEFREQLDRKLEDLKAIEASLERRRKSRQEFAIRKKKERAQVSAAENCGACEGTGWLQQPGGGVVRCDCRKGGARLL